MPIARRQEKTFLDLPRRFTDSQLAKIMNEALIYMCACPAQVCKEIVQLRGLWKYQQDCLKRADAPVVHELIAKKVILAHQVMEECLEFILELEGWDPETLSMPENLRTLRNEEIGLLE